MKGLGYKLTLLTFFIALLSGFYMRIPLQDNLIRAFVIYLIFSALYLIGNSIMNQVTLDSLKAMQKKRLEKKQDRINNASPNMAK
ncbi:MAG: hypothetical protein WAN36_12490 [Calditrichia bacterium]